MSANDLDIWHASMEAADTDAEHTEDARKLFSKGADVITGTEVGPSSGNLLQALRRAAKANDYWFYKPVRPTDSWVAVSKKVSPSRPRNGYINVLEGSDAIGDPHMYGPKGIVWASFEHPHHGRVSVGTVHFLTKGRWEGQSREDDPSCHTNHYALNRKYGREVTKWAVKRAEGGKIAFATGDTNLIDKNTDVFNSDGKLLTCWDEKKDWPDTGYGNIDVIARVKSDRNVDLKSARVHDDADMHMNTDHFPIQAVYTIK